MKRLLTLSLAALLAAGLTACGAAEERGVPAAKPVLYLYPEEETEVTVTLDFDGTLTSTYPDYGDGWTVTARPGGTLTDPATGREYYCLFWEELPRRVRLLRLLRGGGGHCGASWRTPWTGLGPDRAGG